MCVLILVDRPNSHLRISSPHVSFNMTADQKPSVHISREIKVAAVELFKAGVSRGNIRKQLKISISTLYVILKAFQKNPLNPDLERKKGTGRMKLIDHATLKTMKKLLKDTPTLTAKAIKNKVPTLQSVAIRRIQEACQKDLGLPSRKMAKKPFINERMKAQRLEFAEQYQHWTVKEWKKVMFCDESHFELMAGDRVGRCRRAKGSDRYDPKFTRKTVKHPAKIMAWGCFSWHGRGGLEFLKKGEMMDGPRYVRLLITSWSCSCTNINQPTSSKMVLLATEPGLSRPGSRPGLRSHWSSGLVTVLT